MEIRRPEAVAKVLCKDPTTVSISSFLNSVVRIIGVEEEWVVRKAVQQRGFLHHLKDRTLDRSSGRIRHGIEVKGYDRDAVGELFDILASRVELVVVVKIRKSAEEVRRAAHLVANDETPLATALDLKDFHDRAVTAFDLPHDALVDLEGVFASLFEEDWVRDGADVSAPIGARRWRQLSRKMALCDKVATELFRRGRRDRTGRAVRFKTVTVGWRWVVEEQGVDSGFTGSARTL
jgi:hypothetical protein